jgi:hypothetical protein
MDCLHKIFINVQYVGMRVSQVYDVDNKTYLIKLQKPEAKERTVLVNFILQCVAYRSINSKVK